MTLFLSHYHMVLWGNLGNIGSEREYQITPCTLLRAIFNGVAIGLSAGLVIADYFYLIVHICHHYLVIVGHEWTCTAGTTNYTVIGQISSLHQS